MSLFFKIHIASFTHFCKKFGAPEKQNFRELPGTFFSPSFCLGLLFTLFPLSNQDMHTLFVSLMSH